MSTLHVNKLKAAVGTTVNIESGHKITGAAGSIGKELSMRLINEGHTICAFDCNEDSLFRLRMDLRQKNNELQKIVESGASFIPFSMDSVMLHHYKPKV